MYLRTLVTRKEVQDAISSTFAHAAHALHEAGGTIFADSHIILTGGSIVEPDDVPIHIKLLRNEIGRNVLDLLLDGDIVSMLGMNMGILWAPDDLPNNSGTRLWDGEKAIPLPIPDPLA